MTSRANAELRSSKRGAFASSAACTFMTVSLRGFKSAVRNRSAVVGEPKSGELPAMLRVKEIAVSDAAVAVGRRHRGAAQHQLVDHEFTVVFAERTFHRAVAGVGRVGAPGPLPNDSEGVVEPSCARGDLPLHFGRQ